MKKSVETLVVLRCRSCFSLMCTSQVFWSSRQIAKKSCRHQHTHSHFGLRNARRQELVDAWKVDPRSVVSTVLEIETHRAPPLLLCPGFAALPSILTLSSDAQSMHTTIPKMRTGSSEHTARCRCWHSCKFLKSCLHTHFNGSRC